MALARVHDRARTHSGLVDKVALTKGNLTAPWIAFEAGAIANTFGPRWVCPYLLDVEIAQFRKLVLPYALFNAVSSTKTGTEQLVYTIANCLPENERLEERRLRSNFRAFWPGLNKAIAQANRETEPPSEHEQLLEQNKLLLEQMKLQDAKLGAILSNFTEMLKTHYGRLEQ